MWKDYNGREVKASDVVWFDMSGELAHRICVVTCARGTALPNEIPLRDMFTGEAFLVKPGQIVYAGQVPWVA